MSLVNLLRVTDLDDSERCEGTGHHGGQCLNRAMPGSRYCKVCIVRRTSPMKSDATDYLIEKFERRVKVQCDPGEEIKLLRENLMAINAIIAARRSLIVDDASLTTHASPLVTHLAGAEKITASLIKLERESDQLLSKEAVIKLCGQICQAIVNNINGKFEGWENTIVDLSNDIGKLVQEATNKSEGEIE